MARLLKSKVELASEGFKTTYQEHLAGRHDGAALYEWSKRLLAAEREMNNSLVAGQKALEGHLKRMQEFEAYQLQAYEAGRLTHQGKLFAEFVRVEAELWLERHKSK